MQTPADMRADEEEADEPPIFRASTDYASPFERLPLDPYSSRYFHLFVLQRDGRVRLARLTSPGFGVSVTPFMAECVFSLLDEWFALVHGRCFHRFVDDVQVWARTEAEAAQRLASVRYAGNIVRLPTSDGKTMAPTKDGLEYLGVSWTTTGIALPDTKRHRLQGWLTTLTDLTSGLDAVRGWQTSLGILGHAASVRRDLWPLTMWLLKGKMAIDRGESIPEVAEWAAKEALKHDPTAPASSTRSSPYAIIGSDASDSGWGAVIQTTAGTGGLEIFGALGAKAEGLSSMVRELLALWAALREVRAPTDAAATPRLVLWMCDNAGAVYTVNRLFSTNGDTAGLLCAITSVASETAIQLIAVQVPRAAMAHEDALSRLHANPRPSHAANRRRSAADELGIWRAAHRIPSKVMGALG